MANVDAATGFTVVRTPNSSVRRFYLDGSASPADAVAVGDLAKVVGDSSTLSIYPTADPITTTTNTAVASDDYIGPIVAVYDSNEVEVGYLAASTAGFIDVETDPDAELMIQSTGSLTELDSQTCFDMLYNDPSETYKRSRCELEATGSAAADGASKQFMVIGLYHSADNAWGSNVNVIVRANEHVRIANTVSL